jgi:hypothetical protein
VQDDGGTANGGVDLDQLANTITIDVNAVNDEPSGTDNTVTTNEDTPYVFTVSDFGFSDAIDGDSLLAVTISTLPADGTLKLNGVAVIAGDSIPVADITAGNLTFEPTANENGAGFASFTFQVQDDGGTANGGVDLDQLANTITIDVNAVNDEPGELLFVPTTDGSSFTPGFFTASDVEGDTLEFSIVDASDGTGGFLDGGDISVNPTTGVLTIAPGSLVGTAWITVRADDNNGGITDTTFQLLLGNNDPNTIPEDGVFTLAADNNIIIGRNDTDSVDGSDGTDFILGGNATDTIDGGLGSDVIIGGAGNSTDALLGGLGDDVFKYIAVGDSQPQLTRRDTIGDFEGAGVAGGDKIDLSLIDANDVVTLDQAFTFGGTTATAFGVWWTTDGTNTTVFVSDDADTTADMVINLTGVTNLTADDFIL